MLGVFLASPTPDAYTSVIWFTVSRIACLLNTRLTSPPGSASPLTLRDELCPGSSCAPHQSLFRNCLSALGPIVSGLLHQRVAPNHSSRGVGRAGGHRSQEWGMRAAVIRLSLSSSKQDKLS
jgi:hypothetical protein